MKKVLIILGVVIAVAIGALFIPQKETEYDYLRLHIRANSNTEVDQQVKYEIKDLMVEFLTPYLCNVNSKEKAIEIVNSYSNILKSKSVISVT